MAAGRQHVSRRREYYSYCYSSREEEVVHYKNGTHDAKLSRGGGNHKHKNGHRFLSNGGRCSGPTHVETRFDDAFRFKDDKASKSDDAVQLPPEKKRKFLPIIWDLDDKEVRISSKNRIVPATTTLPCPKSSVCLVRRVLNVVSDEVVAKSPILGNQVKGLEFLSEKSRVDDNSVGTTALHSPEGLSPSLPQAEQIGDDNVDGVRLEVEGKFVQVQNISTSRWASDSPRDMSLFDSEDTHKSEEQPSERSTSESGKFYIESPEDGARLLGSHGIGGGHSTRDEHSENELVDDDVMDFDKTSDEVTAVDEPPVLGQRNNNMIKGCRSVFEFEKLNKINEGTYGIVYRARDKKTGEIVALKKVKMNLGRKQDYLEYGFPSSSLREINILLSFNHPSIVNVKEVVMDDLDSVFMVMEYMEHDLKGLMESMKQPFSTSEVKYLMQQLLEGVKYLHDNWVLHRDLKTSNLLLNNQGELKICDFGMSRQYGSPLKPYTQLVVTLWYRAPELLLGAKEYSTAVDMWSVGCIMAEMLAKKPLFNGKSEADQIDKIFKTLGTPTEKIWPGLSELPGARANFVKQPYNLLRKRFPATSFIGSPVLSELGFDLLNKLLAYDPDERITVDAALNHEWFCEGPLPKFKEFMPIFPPQNAYNRHLQGLLEREEFGLQKCSGECQQNHLLNAPWSEEAPLWHRCEPNFVQA